MPPFMDPQESDNEAFIEVTNLSDRPIIYIQDPSMSKPKLLLKKESLGSAKQISVDPISLKESNELAITHPKTQPLTIPDIPSTPNKKFLSSSLPNSTALSPEFVSKKKKNQFTQLPSPLSSTNHLARQHSHSVALTNLHRLREIHLQRSKSCGEGRASAPPEEFDIWFAPNNNVKHVAAAEDTNKLNNNSSFQESSEGVRTDGTYKGKMLEGRNQEEKFKCGALCLFIPGLGKGIKHIRSGRRQESGITVSSSEMGHVVSRTVSLEKFECGSWTSSAAIMNDVGDSSNNMFFDLPMELIRCSTVNDDTLSPVTTAFVFDKEVKGVLKNTTTTTTHRKSHESARHVRFSTSSPTSYPPSPTSCITPRILKAREDFTTFLEAQSA
ncbi:uncharacterized protein LOC107815240 [Nicotiana tabacum]|uniref:Uncharacterized protein LOC107815240 n=1 Tax=Nicotiana tabacum TaxID=4097 RepID=A0A1S4C5A9_TOBAC|nr:uncharacterized protein LOC104089938 [Nicotiana tomentosiformis]XP_016496283.1 PREDICTED: uncharacterized protein LOC107815240 [Nicotiana tabacum]